MTALFRIYNRLMFSSNQCHIWWKSSLHFYFNCDYLRRLVCCKWLINVKRGLIIYPSTVSPTCSGHITIQNFPNKDNLCDPKFTNSHPLRFEAIVNHFDSRWTPPWLAKHRISNDGYKSVWTKPYNNSYICKMKNQFI